MQDDKADIKIRGVKLFWSSGRHSSAVIRRKDDCFALVSEVSDSSPLLEGALYLMIVTVSALAMKKVALLSLCLRSAVGFTSPPARWVNCCFLIKKRVWPYQTLCGELSLRESPKLIL